MPNKTKSANKKIDVLYYTPFYSGRCTPRLARMHDLWHYMIREGNKFFDYEILGATCDSSVTEKVEVPFEKIGKFLHKSRSYKRIIQKTVMRKKLDEKDFDIFHPIHFDAYSVDLLRFVKKHKDVKTVMGPNILGYFEGRKGDKFDLDKVSRSRRKIYEKRYKLKKKYLKSDLIDGVLALGKYHKRLLKSIGTPEEKISLLPPAVDPKYFGEESNKKAKKDDIFKILYVGTFREFKGIGVFLEALERLKMDTDIHFEGILVGEGDYPVEKHGGVEENIKKIGYVDRSKVSKYYNQADVYVHPSVEEVGAGTMIESLACGTPVIATDRLGFREYDIQDVCKFFEERNSEELKQKIIDSYKRSQHSKNLNNKYYLMNGGNINTMTQIYNDLI